MTNPVSPIPSAQIPPYSEHIVDNDGLATPLFHRFLVGLYQRTGGSAGASIGSVEVLANEALAVANVAEAEAELANLNATAAEAAASSAQSSAATASAQAASAALLAQQTANTAMSGSANLSDVSSVAISRINLGVNTVPLTFSFDTLPGSLKRGIPILQAMVVGAQFVGSVAWSGVNATADTVLTIQRYRAGAYITFGSLTFASGGTGHLWSISPAFDLVNGDVLVVVLPSVPDATLAQVALTISARLS